jgi:hypothetical protein
VEHEVEQFINDDLVNRSRARLPPSRVPGRSADADSSGPTTARTIAVSSGGGGNSGWAYGWHTAGQQTDIGGVGRRVLRHKWVRFGRLAHIVFTVVPYALLLAAFAASYHLRTAELRADAPDQDPAARPLQVHLRVRALAARSKVPLAYGGATREGCQHSERSGTTPPPRPFLPADLDRGGGVGARIEHPASSPMELSRS